jgi:hypothetical protein
MFDGPVPTPPFWAVEAGLDEPYEDETFRAYVRRLGLDPSELLADLTPRTAVVANIRLAHKIAQLCPQAWERHLQEFVRAHAKVTYRPSDNGRAAL